jgi:hypothetical protein
MSQNSVCLTEARDMINKVILYVTSGAQVELKGEGDAHDMSDNKSG